MRLSEKPHKNTRVQHTTHNMKKNLVNSVLSMTEKTLERSSEPLTQLLESLPPLSMVVGFIDYSMIDYQEPIFRALPSLKATIQRCTPLTKCDADRAVYFVEKQVLDVIMADRKGHDGSDADLDLYQQLVGIVGLINRPVVCFVLPKSHVPRINVFEKIMKNYGGRFERVICHT
jgi:hypothetical protein